MGWSTVGHGNFASGEGWRIERRTLNAPVPKSGVPVLPIQLRSYRWLLVGFDGVVSVQGRAKAKADLEVEIQSFEPAAGPR